jgi:DNA-binding beta-propeller fold protein YncE
LYASTGSNFLGVMDTTTNTLLTPIDIGTPTRDIEALSNNRLIAVTGQDSNWSDLIEIVLPPAGPAQITTLPAGFISVYSGELALAPDRQTVFYGNFGLSAATFAKINVSVPGTISIPFNTSDLGGNGQDVGLSRDGSLVGFAVGGGNDIAYPYDIGVIRTSDMAVLGSFNTGAYPREIEFAPDAGFAYTVNDSGEIKVFSTQTFLKTDTFTFTESPSHEEAQELFVEKSGQYLFASTSDQLLVYQTGRLIPIPEPSSIALFGLAAIALQKRRRQAAM